MRFTELTSARGKMPFKALTASDEVSSPGVLIYDWTSGPITTIELCNARALELAIAPIGFKVVEAEAVIGTKAVSDVWDDPGELDGAVVVADFAAVDKEPGEADRTEVPADEESDPKICEEDCEGGIIPSPLLD